LIPGVVLMSEARSHRVAVSFTEREHNALQTTAYRTRLPLAGLVARIVRASLESGQLNLPDPVATSAAGSTGSPAARNAPPWLPPLASGDYDDWAQGCAGAVAALIDRYPRELAALADDWAKDAPVREQLWALAIWRRHLDVGTYGDPRTELAFAGALQDFEVYSRERARTSLRGRR
jgi:hypothetical protein